MKMEPSVFSLQRAEPLDGIEIDQGYLRLRNGGGIPVASGLEGCVHGRRLICSAYIRDTRLGMFVPRQSPHALLHIRTEELDFGGDPVPGEPELWPGAEGQAASVDVALQLGDRRGPEQEQIVRVHQNKPVWIVDLEGRSMLFNYRQDGRIEFLPASPLEVARGILEVLKVNHSRGRMVFTRTAHWASRNLTAMVAKTDFPSDILRAEFVLRKKLGL